MLSSATAPRRGCDICATRASAHARRLPPTSVLDDTRCGRPGATSSSHERRKKPQCSRSAVATPWLAPGCVPNACLGAWGAESLLGARESRCWRPCNSGCYPGSRQIISEPSSCVGARACRVGSLLGSCWVVPRHKIRDRHRDWGKRATEISSLALRLDVPATSPHHGRRLGVGRFAPSLRCQYWVASRHGRFSLRSSLGASAFLIVACCATLLPWPVCSSRVVGSASSAIVDPLRNCFIGPCSIGAMLHRTRSMTAGLI
jgi:hypothetical protein